MGTLTQKTNDGYTIGILCAMNLERNAVLYMLDKEHRPLPTDPGDPNSYTLGELHGHNVVLACLPSQQGKGAAATVATNMARSFPSIKLRLFVGIGGGVPSAKHDIRLGDVVISMPEGEHGGVVQYDLGRQTNWGFEVKGFLWPPPAILRNAAQDMESRHLGHGNKIDEYIGAMTKKGPRLAVYNKPSAPDILFRDDYSHPDGAPACAGHCDMTRIVNRPERPWPGPEIHYGLIASGDSVIKNAEIRDTLSKSFNQEVLCFEMEAAGLMTEFPSLVVRGISDYADSHKNNSWQHYAAATAAACAKELLSYVNPEVAVAEPVPSSAHEVAPASVVFTGRGVQQTGSGSLSVGKDLNIR
ncbi:nucleoside phosphorylase domain-containing protein [Nemania sp. NC0429]|nr:nucleoside phosphorylase domain-containing protein [Nemania sp. NC0429]